MSSLWKITMMLATASVTRSALAQHEDVWLDVVDGKVVTTIAVDALCFRLDPQPVDPFTADPGWNAAVGTFAGGSLLGWNAVDAFKVWNGAGFELTGGEFLEIAFSTLAFEVHDAPVEGFELFVQPDGGFHE